MGLDMNAYTTIETLASEVDFDVEQHEVLHYWCKHANLHGWMEQLYFAKRYAPNFSIVQTWLSMSPICSV